MRLGRGDFWADALRNQTFWLGLGLALCSVLAAWAITLATSNLYFEQFVFQAEGFARGSVYFARQVPLPIDVSPGLAGSYWPLGPFPALLLTPLVNAGGIMPWQTWLSLALTPLALYLAYAAARRSGHAAPASIWLGLAFVFGSVYLGVTVRAASWQFSSAVAGVLVLLGVWEYLGKRRYALIGLLAAAALATRATAGLALALFAVLALVFEQGINPRRLVQPLIYLAVPLLIAAGCLAFLNHSRTGDYFDFGYASANINQDIAGLRDRYGLFSWRNVPTNVYYYFLAPPQPVREPGSYHLDPPYLVGASSMSFFLVSPVFLWLWRIRPRSSGERAAAWALLGGVIVLLSYYSVNVGEFGPRYLIDVLPFAYLLLLFRFGNSGPSALARAVIGGSIALNFYLAATMYSFGSG